MSYKHSIVPTYILAMSFTWKNAPQSQSQGYICSKSKFNNTLDN